MPNLALLREGARLIRSLVEGALEELEGGGNPRSKLREALAVAEALEKLVELAEGGGPRVTRGSRRSRARRGGARLRTRPAPVAGA